MIATEIQTIEFCRLVPAFGRGIGSVDCVVSQRFTGGPATEQKYPCTLKKDRVGCAADHIVIERIGVAHRLILVLGHDMSGRPDSRGGREVPRGAPRS